MRPVTVRPRFARANKAAQDAVRVEEPHPMSAPITHPTPYPDVNAVLHDLLAGVQAVHFEGRFRVGRHDGPAPLHSGTQLTGE